MAVRSHSGSMTTTSDEETLDESSSHEVGTSVAAAFTVGLDRNTVQQCLRSGLGQYIVCVAALP